MAIAFTFPGQGSQALGMGKDLADAFPQAAAVFAEVDEALGEKLSDIMWNGPEETLTLTANAQPALMAVSIAALRVLESKGLDLKSKVSYVAGHSLGEYSALCAAGTFSLADTARLLRIRGNAMQAAVPVGKGAMAAIIGLEHSDVDAVCIQAQALGSCQIANDNGGGQLVISGEKTAVEKAAALATEKGAKRAILLPVSAPFHFQPDGPSRRCDAGGAGNRCKARSGRAADCQCARSPRHRCRRDRHTSGRAGHRSGPLARNRRMVAANDVTTLYEIGSGKVLTGLARRIDKSVTGIAINSPADIDAAIQVLLGEK